MALIDFSDAPFYQISIDDWYSISRLRQRVFVVEQHCPYLDADGKDLPANHIIGRNDLENIIAYARIVAPQNQKVAMGKLEYLKAQKINSFRSKLDHQESGFFMPAIGRVVIDPSMRGKGQGDVLMNYTLSCCNEKYPRIPIFISAQKPLHDFYTRHGFVQSGPDYLEDGIPHIPMVYN